MYQILYHSSNFASSHIRKINILDVHFDLLKNRAKNIFHYIITRLRILHILTISTLSLLSIFIENLFQICTIIVQIDKNLIEAYLKSIINAEHTLSNFPICTSYHYFSNLWYANQFIMEKMCWHFLLQHQAYFA